MSNMHENQKAKNFTYHAKDLKKPTLSYAFISVITTLSKPTFRRKEYVQ